MTDDNSDRILAHGSRARALMTDPLMQSVLAALRQAVSDQFFSTPPDDAKARELLHHMSGAQRRFESALTSLIESAEIESSYRNDEAMRIRADQMIDSHVRSR